MGGNTRRQHYIPQFYLRGFANGDQRFTCYSLEKDRFYPTNVKDACVQRDLHEEPLPATAKRFDLLTANSIENRLAKIEDEIASPLYNLLYALDHYSCDSSTYMRGKEAVCRFFSKIPDRQPESIEHFASLAENVSISHLARRGFRGREYEVFREQGFITEDDIRHASRYHGKELVLLSEDKRLIASRLYGELMKRRMDVLKAPIGSTFIVTSNPLLFDGLCERHKKRRIVFDYAFFPLSSKYAAFFRDPAGDWRFGECSFESVRFFNAKLLAVGAPWRYAYGAASIQLKLAVDAARPFLAPLG